MAHLVLVPGWHVYHKSRLASYDSSNSLAGIRLAWQKGYEGIDLDLSMDSDGLAWCKHPPLGRAKPFAKMTTAEIKRRTPPALSLSAGLAECKRLHLTACLEVKGDRRFTLDYFLRLRKWCDQHKVEPIIMTLPQGKHGIEIMQAAHHAGFRTMWLWRGAIPESHYAHLTYVKKGARVYRVEH